MYTHFRILVILLLVCNIFNVLPQIPDTARHIRHAEIFASDTTITEQDRERYEITKKKAQKRKWTDILYSAFFSEPEPPDEAITSGSLDKQYEPYDGMMINDIKIIVLAPFGTDINHPDSININNWFNKVADNLHINTKHYIVRGNLLFKAGDVVNPLVMAESEAFLRNTGYIHDARIQIDSIPNLHMANVTVTVRDVFSIGLNLHDLSLNSIDFEIFDKNFLGIGNRSWIRGIYDNNFGSPFGYGAGYHYANLMNTFINLEGSFLNRVWATEISASAERPLQSSLHYYGQVAYSQTKLQLNEAPWDSVSPPFQENFSISFGKAFNPFGHESPKRIAIAARYINNNSSYASVIPDIPNPLQYEYVSSRSFLTQYSFFSQRYYRQYMIHNFGITENIASGYRISGQLGYTNCPGFFKGMYSSLDVAAGRQYDFGNLYVRAAVGSHFNHNGFYQGIVRFNGNYFTPLLRTGKSRLRQFVNVNYAQTLKPVDGVTDYVYFSTLSTMRTSYFDQEAKGSERFMVNLETDIFTSLNIVGFRVLLFSFIDSGWLKMNGNLFDPNNFYYGFGLGLRIRNDLLVFRTLVMKIGYYPRFNQDLGNIFQFSTSEPQQSPSFIPDYPQEIILK